MTLSTHARRVAAFSGLLGLVAIALMAAVLHPAPPSAAPASEETIISGAEAFLTAPPSPRAHSPAPATTAAPSATTAAARTPKKTCGWCLGSKAEPPPPSFRAAVPPESDCLRLTGRDPEHIIPIVPGACVVVMPGTAQGVIELTSAPPLQTRSCRFTIAHGVVAIAGPGSDNAVFTTVREQLQLALSLAGSWKTGAHWNAWQVAMAGAARLVLILPGNQAAGSFDDWDLRLDPTSHGPRSLQRIDAGPEDGTIRGYRMIATWD